MAFRSTVFVGGLGDMILTMYESDNFTRFETLQPGDTGTIAFFTVNPFVSEIFHHHPKRAQLTIKTIPLCYPVSPEIIREAGVDPADGWKPRKHPVVHYKSPLDVQTLAGIGGKYVVFALAAGHPFRNIPLEIAKQAVAMTVAHGYKAVLLGRTYDVKAVICWYDRQEVLIEPQEGVVDLIDKLTVPGSLASVEGAAGVVCTHSAICLESWFRKRPTYTLYPPNMVGQWDHPSHTRFWPGVRNPESWHGTWDAWNPDNFRLFLESLK